MMEFNEWRLANDKYLADALGWLRQRLEALATPETVIETDPGPVTAVVRVSEANPWLPARLFRKPKEMIVLPAATSGATAQSSRPAQNPAGSAAQIPQPSFMIEAESAEPPPALIVLARRLGLSEFERLTLLLCAALELDTRIGPLCARAQEDPAKPYPTFALALALFDNPAWEVLSPERPLRYWRLIEIFQPGIQPLVSSALRADERIVHYLKGLNYLDDRLMQIVQPPARTSVNLPPSQRQVLDTILEQIRRRKGAAQSSLIQLLGSDQPGKLAITQQVAGELNLTLYRLFAESVPLQQADQETFIRLWQRESVLLPIALFIDAGEVDHRTGPQAAAIRQMLTRGLGITFLAASESWSEAATPSLTVSVEKPTVGEQRSAWTEALGQNSEQHADRLAGHFNFTVADIRAVSERALASAAGDADRMPDLLWESSVQQARPAMNRLAEPVTATAQWDDLQLPASEKDALRQIVSQVSGRLAVYDHWGFRQRMSRGLGITVLFAGESGTGKTMAAEVMANELQLPLYRIDLSAVVNKYIGETEKNLRRVFDAAENGAAILLFDEADALFGKRSEVRDSHDRFANIEINYLLQRMEAYRGLAILATNMKSAMDQAFVRRLRFIINFPFPGQEERTAIWKNVFPPETPVSALDYVRLGKLAMTGGSIHNVAVNAAFSAARNGTPVTMPLILEAARTEFRKLERPINEADFRWLERSEARA
jgi:hypothetical protein